MKYLSPSNMILSFHPMFEADRNILCAGRDPGDEELAAIRSAKAVILPQACRESLYRMARRNCPNVFPNYDARFDYPGKIAQIRLFEEKNVPYPETFCYRTVDEFVSLPSRLSFPLVFKFDWGGEGDTVFPVSSDSELRYRLAQASEYEKTGQKGFMLQEFIPFQHRSLRVAVIGSSFISYWRVQSNPDVFHANLSKGAVIDHHSDPELRDKAVAVLREFCAKTGINLAGSDFLFSSDKTPLFLEINYFFGREGLGGSENFYRILGKEIGNWLESESNTYRL